MLNTCLTVMTQWIFWKQVNYYEAILVISLPPYPAGGLNQTTPDSPLWTQLAFTKTHQALWRQFVAHNPPRLYVQLPAEVW